MWVAVKRELFLVVIGSLLCFHCIGIIKELQANKLLRQQLVRQQAVAEDVERF